MNIINKILLTFALLLLADSHSQAYSGDLKPGISLFSFSGEQTTKQSQDDPLLLYVSVANMSGLSILRENKRNEAMLNDYLKKNDVTAETEKALTTANPTDQPWQIILGSAKHPISSLLNLQIRDQQGDSINLETTLFEPITNQMPYGELSIKKTLIYAFAVSSEQLQQLPTGDYSLAVGIDTRSAQDMWQGWAYSNTLKLSLGTANPVSQETRAALKMAYLIGINQYTEAERIANDWIQSKPSSVDAYSALGDALAGQDKPKQALKAYYAALANFNKLHNGVEPEELPLRLIKRIDELESQ